MDAYSLYNYIPMYKLDEEHKSFITDRRLYCYKGMPFSLKSTRATYQRLVNAMFKDFIGETMEVYVDNVLVKSRAAIDHVDHLRQMFSILRRYQMNLKPLKCAFGVRSGKFLRHMVNQQGIKTNPKNIKVLLDMCSPQKPRGSDEFS